MTRETSEQEQRTYKYDRSSHTTTSATSFNPGTLVRKPFGERDLRVRTQDDLFPTGPLKQLNFAL